MLLVFEKRWLNQKNPAQSQQAEQGDGVRRTTSLYQLRTLRWGGEEMEA